MLASWLQFGKVRKLRDLGFDSAQMRHSLISTWSLLRMAKRRDLRMGTERLASEEGEAYVLRMMDKVGT
jgi:hypothetical protein